jgi:IS30 family transposase
MQMWRRFSEEERQTIWDMREAGVPIKRIARHPGRQNVSLRKFIADAGGKRPTARQRSELRLSLEEREEISRGLAASDSVRAIAEALGRSPSTVCREVNANGGRRKYRAFVADRAASRNALRPKRAKLAECRRLRGVVERKLEARWSPQQISAWLALEYPDRPEMQVSHETIYQSLFVQSRGALRKELHSCLRTGRAMRRAKAYTKGNVGQGQLKNMVMISERPAELKDRAVPGHWEGDLIFGKKMTSIGTLVERHSRYVILLKLPNGHGAEAVRKAMTKRILTCPASCDDPSPGTKAKRWPSTSASRSRPVCRSTSVTPRVHGSAAATKTPTACFANTYPSPQTSPKPHSGNSTPSLVRSTQDLDRRSAG